MGPHERRYPGAEALKWFGSSWGAPVCTPETHAERPDAPCMRCDQPFDDTSQGIILPGADTEGRPYVAPFHVECFIDALGLRARG